MPVPSNPSRAHQEAVGKLIKIMEADGFTILEAQYGSYRSPTLREGRRPDVFGVKGLLCGIGEVEMHDDLRTEGGRLDQLADLQRWASKQSGGCKLFLGIVGHLSSDEVDVSLSLATKGWYQSFFV